MISLHRSSAERGVTGHLPTRLVKQILTVHGVKIGAKVLLVGGIDNELVALLDYLSYDVSTLHDSHQAVSAAEHEFDLLIVQDLDDYHRNMLDLRCRTTTANLISCLKAGGDLVFMCSQDSSVSGATQHDASCWKRHLACFPGELETTTHHQSFFETSRWDWLFGARSHHDYLTATLQLPAEQFPRNSWLEFAHRGPMTGQCCTGVPNDLTETHRRAA